ncbi:hypothetical protein D3C80_1938650 [compost metagenome]
MILAGFGVLAAVVISMFVVPGMIYFGHEPAEFAGGLALVGWVFFISIALILGLDKAKKALENRRRKARPFERRKKEPGVFVQAIIDKHNKFCTLVTAE